MPAWITELLSSANRREAKYGGGSSSCDGVCCSRSTLRARLDLRSRLRGRGGDVLQVLTGVRGPSSVSSSSCVDTDGDGVEAGVGVPEKLLVLLQGTDLDRIIVF